MNTFRYILPFLAAAAPLSSFGLTHSRAYQWGFQAGNLLSNWSFENRLEFWKDTPVTSFTLDAHFKASGTVPGGAMSGSYVARIMATQSTGNTSTIVSDLFPMGAGTTYTLSFYYQTSGSIAGTIHPVLLFYSNPNNVNIAGIVGTNLMAASSWTLYTFSFTSPSDIQYAQLSLAEFNGVQATLYLDNVGLEEGNPGPSAVLVNPSTYSEAATFGDGLGRGLQTQTKSVKAGNTYLVQGMGLDSLARPETTFAPIPYALSAPAYQSALLTGANSVYGASGPYNAHGYPFSRVKYSDEPGSRILESSTPDSAWRLGGAHTVKQGYYFTNDSLVPSNIENPSTNTAECKYMLTWSKSQDSTYSLVWTNKLGQVIRRATNVTRTGSSASAWKWSATRYAYYPNGTLQKTYTPLDDSAGTAGFAEVNEYDAQGQLVSAFSPDRNLRKSWYNRQGVLRYTQDEEQRAIGEFTYYDYDDQGRLVSEGVQSQIGTAPPQDSIDKDTYSQGVKLEQIGYVYDDTATFQARTGFSLQEILGYWINAVAVPNLSHRLFCKYNRNTDSPYSRFTDKDKFVADFFTYDAQGNPTTSWKYVGPIRDSEKRLQDIWYTYDQQNRMTRYSNYASANSTTLSSMQVYTYDFQGRVDSITGLSGNPWPSTPMGTGDPWSQFV